MLLPVTENTWWSLVVNFCFAGLFVVYLLLSACVVALHQPLNYFTTLCVKCIIQVETNTRLTINTDGVDPLVLVCSFSIFADPDSSGKNDAINYTGSFPGVR